MPIALRSLENSLKTLDARVQGLQANSGRTAPAIEKWRADAAAVLFHLQPRQDLPALVCILGGTGTGKSTLVNRLIGANVSAASFRRTFTAGAVAVAKARTDLPVHWLMLPHSAVSPNELPARGQPDSLLVVESSNEILEKITLVDTPDLDGDQPAHHSQADRAFRWAQGVVFLVSPEKYQMTELLPYYRLVKRYHVPALFVMNKCQSAEVLTDYLRMLEELAESAQVYCIARDDSTYEPAPESNLSALRSALAHFSKSDEAQRSAGAVVRVTDLLGRLRDSVITPQRDARRAIDTIVNALWAMETPAPGVDVNPITEQLQRRLQQRSVLYLIGPGRVLDRVRQVPSLLVRLPRTAWDAVVHGKSPTIAAIDPAPQTREVPDFGRTLADQFTIVQSRIEDLLRSNPLGQQWMSDVSGYSSCRIDPAEASKIAEEELANLKEWLQKRWDATPRDTAILLRLLRHLPGGEKLTQWSEAAPYLLAVIVAAHHAFFWHTDLVIIGGYTLATWLSERLSNEVAWRTRQINRTIALRFEKLAHEQIKKTVAFLQSQAPSAREIEAVSDLADQWQESISK